MSPMRLLILMTLAMPFMCGCATLGNQPTDVCRTCGGLQDEIPTPPVGTSQIFAAEYAEALHKTSELSEEVRQLRSDRDGLWDRIARLEKQREISLVSMTQANQEVGITRQELDTAVRDITAVRNEISTLVDTISTMDSAHTGQIDQFSTRLDGLLNRLSPTESPGQPSQAPF